MNKKKIYPWWFLVLPLVLYVIFFLLPSAMGVGYSFTDWNSRSVLNGTHFVGLQNFKEILTSNKGYLSGIGNTLKFTIISNIVKLIPALMIAIMLQEGLRGKGLYRTLLYLPSILPFVIIGLIFKSILNYNTGLLNTILDALHLGILKQKWLSDLGIVWKSIYGVDAWRGIGYVMTIFLAGLNRRCKLLAETSLCNTSNAYRFYHDQPCIWYYIWSESIRYRLRSYKRRSWTCNRGSYNLCIPALLQRSVWNVFCIEYDPSYHYGDHRCRYC